MPVLINQGLKTLATATLDFEHFARQQGIMGTLQVETFSSL